MENNTINTGIDVSEKDKEITVKRKKGEKQSDSNKLKKTTTVHERTTVNLVPKQTTVRKITLGTTLNEEVDFEKDSNKNENIIKKEQKKNNYACLDYSLWIIFAALILSFCLAPLALRKFKLPDFSISFNNTRGNRRPLYSSKYNLYFYVTEEAYEKLDHIPKILQIPLYSAANKMIEERIEICREGKRPVEEVREEIDLKEEIEYADEDSKSFQSKISLLAKEEKEKEREREMHIYKWKEETEMLCNEFKELEKDSQAFLKMEMEKEMKKRLMMKEGGMKRMNGRGRGRVIKSDDFLKKYKVKNEKYNLNLKKEKKL